MLPECRAHLWGPARGLHSSLSPPGGTPRPPPHLLALSLSRPPPCVPPFLPPPALEVSPARPPVPSFLLRLLSGSSGPALLPGKASSVQSYMVAAPTGSGGGQPESDMLRKSRGQALVWGWVGLEVPAEPSGGREEERGGRLRTHPRGQRASRPPASLAVSGLRIEAPSYRGEN